MTIADADSYSSIIVTSSYDQELTQVADLLRTHRTVVLSGAGMSTASGIPDYRGPTSSQRPRRPIQYREFRDRAEARTRYWARSAVGWPWINAREPNVSHEVIARLESEGFITGAITQNVDGLHQRAGSVRVLELHGTLSEVLCLDCGASDSRRDFQERILELNPLWQEFSAEIAPDGDAELPREVTEAFVVPSCRVCGGVLKPNVVFFGESVPKGRVAAAWDMLEEAEALLVVGSSLTVYSGFRFVDRASKDGKPVVIVNQGATRGDPVADLRIDERLEEALPALLRALGSDAA